MLAGGGDSTLTAALKNLRTRLGGSTKCFGAGGESLFPLAHDCTSAIAAVPSIADVCGGPSQDGILYHRHLERCVAAPNRATAPYLLPTHWQIGYTPTVYLDSEKETGNHAMHPSHDGCLFFNGHPIPRGRGDRGRPELQTMLCAQSIGNHTAQFRLTDPPGLIGR